MKQDYEILVNGYKLDQEQLTTVLENRKYSLIIAGAGSGKSLTLIGKIKYLLDNHIYKADQICCISFTNEATVSLKNNIIKNTGQDVTTLTFHKLALSIIKESNSSYKIASTSLLDEVIDEFFYSKCFGSFRLVKIVFILFKKFIRNEKSWNNLLNSKELISLKKTIKTFISLFKSNGYKEDVFKTYLKNRKYKNLVIIIYAIFLIYESEKSGDNSIDFDDMMNYSLEILKKSGCNLPFKLIIIDEFQDTSLCRFLLIKEIVKQNDAALCVVGDDYQSIYHFSGCDLNIFLNFKDYYEDAKIYKLERTYRNSIELIETSGNFVMKNPNQVKKKLTSPKNLQKPIIISYYKNVNRVLEKVINNIDCDKEILIISRNNFDIKKYTNNLKYKLFKDGLIEFEKFPGRKIKFLTIHSSKGLESEIVILLNCEDSIFGMPSKLKDEGVLSLVKKNQPYPYEEERRLFYVALTRTKSYIYLLTPKDKPSMFVEEIKKDKNVSIVNYC